ncbi:mitochondrial NAD transporter [Auricularia subglabra TFB-10046 SS5]|uniref:Mitochondrial NAD transporter n=1 Tax=Auricularia subglabra (strain TFB-10046 / SS5) TaxID=717982 RepID=J0DCY8_AURST|nr:mitochondrial NAD transporter [Auricularia subglabra TFB-10046 SS5]
MPRSDPARTTPPRPAEHKWYSSFLAGGAAGFVSSVATCPLDVIKTRLQAQRVHHAGEGYLGVAGTVRQVFVRDGLKGFYRGLSPTLLGYLPTWAIYFSVYDSIKKHFGEPPLGAVESAAQRRSQHSIIPAAQAKGYQPAFTEGSWSLHILSSVGAGMTSTLCTNPFWVIKTRFMTQPFEEPKYKHTLDAFRTVYRTEGARAFYQGLAPSLLGLMHVVVQFPLYEELKIWARGDLPAPLSSGTILLCSAAAKMTASVATYPHEVVRTRLQIQKRPIAQASGPGAVLQPAMYRGILQTAGIIIREEGWRGLYKGLSVNLFRTVPNSAVTMLTYEMTMRQLSQVRVHAEDDG